MGAIDPGNMTPAVRAAAARLRIDSATAEVLRAFGAAGVESILLKGASNRQWLEDCAAGSRWYADCDLLVRPRDGGAAATALRGLGFSPDLEMEKMPAWWHEPDLAWRRASDGVVIDIHRTLSGVGVDDVRAWALLSADAEDITVGLHRARALGIPARAMHLALHAAHHGPGWAMGFDDLERALNRADQATWRRAGKLAEELDASAAFVAGLRLVPVGQALVERLGLAATASVKVQLVGDSSRAPAITVERFARARNLRTRLSMLHHKLFPPATFMRHWSPLARRGRTGLLLAYLRRPIWVVGRAPAAVRAWRRARTLTRNEPVAPDDQCGPPM